MPKYTIDKVRLIAAKYSYRVLSSEYKNNKSKLLFECQLGHVWNSSLSNFLQGKRCAYCRGSIINIDIVKSFAKENDLILISDLYKNCDSNLRWKCSKGHIFDVSFSSIRKRNTKCTICRPLGVITYDKLKYWINKKRGFIITDKSDFKEKSDELVAVKCQFGHVWKTKPHYLN